MSTTTDQPIEGEMAILARFLGDEGGQMPAELARYILDRQIGPADQSRMRSLLVRNQGDGLPPAEKAELVAFTNAATLLATLKSKSRRALGIELGGGQGG